MKLLKVLQCAGQIVSPPTRGAWIETKRSAKNLRPRLSPPTRGAWIETLSCARNLRTSASPPTRGAWIETALEYTVTVDEGVAPHAGGVD